MAINKERNVVIQVTFPKEDAKHLETLKEAFNKEGIKVSKSDILLKAFQDYLSIVLIAGSTKQSTKNEVEEPQKEKEDA